MFFRRKAQKKFPKNDYNMHHWFCDLFVSFEAKKIVRVSSLSPLWQTIGGGISDGFALK